MYLFVIFSSLFNSLLIGMFGKYFGRQIVIFMALVIMLISLLFALIILYEILLINNIISIEYYVNVLIKQTISKR